MDPRTLQAPLNPVEHHELGLFIAATPGAKSIDWAHGFLTAVASAPSMIAPSVWQPAVLGEPSFATLEEAQHVLHLLTRFYNQVVTGLIDDGAVGPRDMDPAVVAAWCEGYLAATHLDEVWRADDYGRFLLLPLAVLAGQFDLVGEEDDNGAIIEDASSHIERYRAMLRPLVGDIHEYWRDARRAPQPPAPARRAAKIGRNDRCPCGSGLKFKKCCALELH